MGLNLSKHLIGEVVGHATRVATLNSNTVAELDFGSNSGNMFVLSMSHQEGNSVGFDIFVTYGGGDMDDPADPVKSTGPSTVVAGCIMWANSGAGDTDRNLVVKCPAHVSKIKILAPTEAISEFHATLFRV